MENLPRRKFNGSAAAAEQYMQKHSHRLGGALTGHIRSLEKTLSDLALNGEEKYGPDDHDLLIRISRKALTESEDALAELEALAPQPFPDDEQDGHDAVNLYDRLFPEHPERDR
ncbi:hypothetical protein [Streptomyces sp. NPDC017448]|uniref:hypothetical protein n=1 Tax=Streptomyces sp. NPDC017448 TaxID=3364996 RepID=UPI003792A03A